MAVVTDEQKLNSSTSQTSETRGSEHSSSVGERTTPRHNVTPTHTNNFANNVTQIAPPVTQPAPRVSASRIDATGVITGMNTAQVLSWKVAANNHPMAKKKLRNAAYSSAKMTKQKHREIGLIHIQAKDEFMIFEDNTDLVSHITTPSAVRTSPLETDYLVIDHDEFLEEQSLFSALTVPKALRKKRPKKSKKSKDDTIGEEGGIKIAPSTSCEESEDEQEMKAPLEVSPPKRISRQKSLEKQKSSAHSQTGSVKSGRSAKSNRSTKSGRARAADLRGGKREQKANDEAEMSAPKISEEAACSSQGGSKFPVSSTKETKDKGVDDKAKPQSQEEPKDKVSEEETSEEPQSILENTTAVIPATSVATGNAESTETSREKQAQVQKPEEVRRKEVHPILHTSSAMNENSHDAMPVASTKPNRYKFTAPIYSLDVTQTTVIDSTTRTSHDGSNNDGSNHEDMIHEEPIKEESPRKVPNSHKRSKSLKKWLLPTSYFCPTRRKKRQAEAVEESMRRSTSVSDWPSTHLKMERRYSR